MSNSTSHKVYFAASQNMSCLEDESIGLVVTSPPYPMIEMWDEIFALQNPTIATVLNCTPMDAFELMHVELDKVWKECFRLLKDGGLLCINIGDATRTINKEFQLYNNHSRIVDACQRLGFTNLPNIIWRKQTNAPNKFMGSGNSPGNFLSSHSNMSGFLFSVKEVSVTIVAKKIRGCAARVLSFGRNVISGFPTFGKSRE